MYGIRAIAHRGSPRQFEERLAVVEGGTRRLVQRRSAARPQDLAAAPHRTVASATASVAASFVRRLVNVGRLAACLVAQFVNKVLDEIASLIGRVGVRCI